MGKGLGSVKIPVSVLIQEAVDLRVSCEKDRDILIRAGLNWDACSMMNKKLEECKKLETRWNLYKQDYKAQTYALNKLTKECMQVRTELSAHIAFEKARSNIDVKHIGLSQQHARADIVQDLYDLSYTAESMHIKDPLCNIDRKLAARAKQLSTKLSKNTAVHVIDMPAKTALKQKRDKAIAELYNLVNEIRKTGRYVFRNNPLRKKAYASAYRRSN